MTDEEIKKEFVRVSPSGKRLEVTRISWGSYHTPTGEWIDAGPLAENADQSEIDAKMVRILACKRFFRRCRICNELKPLGWMHDTEVCQSCAERYLGIVH